MSGLMFSTSSTNDAAIPIPPVQKDVLEVQKQPVEQTNKQPYSRVKHRTPENVDHLEKENKKNRRY